MKKRYHNEKRKLRHRKRPKSFLWLLLLLVLLFAGAEKLPPIEQQTFVSIRKSADAETTDNEAPTPAGETPTDRALTTESAAQELTVHFIDVGQGDCTLILCGGEAMLIDAGKNGQGTMLQNYIQKLGIQTLKYVIATHPDADHIGGLDVILYKLDCQTILMTAEEKDTNTYRDVIDTMKNKGYKKTVPSVGDTYLLGDAEFTVLGPAQTGPDSNNNSIAVILTHGNNRFLFTGDAEEEEEAEFLESGISLKSDVYKAGHHGSHSSSSLQLLEAVSPAYAVISCGEGNSYGHPHAETLNHFREMGINVFRTDEQGTVIATSDGKNITWNCSPSETWQAGEAHISSPTQQSRSLKQNQGGICIG